MSNYDGIIFYMAMMFFGLSCDDRNETTIVDLLDMKVGDSKTDTFNELSVGDEFDRSVETLDFDVDHGFDRDDLMVNGDIDLAEDMDLGIEADMGAEPPISLLPPTLAQMDTVIDLAAPGQQVWAYMIHVSQIGENYSFTRRHYSPTQGQVNFWPASTIKMYTATAALELINQEGFSIEAVLTYQRLVNGEWIDDVSMSLREMVRRTFDCSSNETYTLLLRFGGVDWFNQNYFILENGFENTALMRDYVTADARPWAYNLQEPQRIIVREGSRELLREHQWSGQSYADQRGCTIYNGLGTANCTSAEDMAEHMRRVIFQEYLPVSERFEIDQSTMDWYRGESNERVLNNTEGDNCGGPVYDGLIKVFNSPILHHKEGLVSEYRGSIHHVYDQVSQTEYVTAVMVDSPQENVLRKLSEELARMMKTPRTYVHLGYLTDYVNPISADLITYSEEPAVLQMMIKPYSEDGYSYEGWEALRGASININAGEQAHRLQSLCLNESRQLHIRGRLETLSGEVAWSDLHYVIVDHEQACQD